MNRYPLTAALPVLMSTAPASAAYFYQQDGSVTYVPDGAIVLVLLFVAAVVLAVLHECMKSSSSPSASSQMSLDLPQEIREPESVQYYDDKTEKTRALKRKLDADIELAESYIRAARTRAKLDE